VLKRRQGQSISLAEALKAALHEVDALMFWSGLAFILKFLVKRLRKRKRKTARAVGVAWRSAGILVIPVIMAENLSVFQAGKRAKDLAQGSWLTLARLWGSGMLLSSILFYLVAIPIFALGAWANNSIALVAAIVGVVLIAALWHTYNIIVKTLIYCRLAGY
jgi:membrane-anchored glycerophosphoryl diester phosphodiesterase (GDPDase)